MSSSSAERHANVDANFTQVPIPRRHTDEGGQSTELGDNDSGPNAARTGSAKHTTRTLMRRAAKKYATKDEWITDKKDEEDKTLEDNISLYTMAPYGDAKMSNMLYPSVVSAFKPFIATYSPEVEPLNYKVDHRYNCGGIGTEPQYPMSVEQYIALAKDDMSDMIDALRYAALFD